MLATLFLNLGFESPPFFFGLLNYQTSKSVTGRCCLDGPSLMLHLEKLQSRLFAEPGRSDTPSRARGFFQMNTPTALGRYRAGCFTDESELEKSVAAWASKTNLRFEGSNFQERILVH